MNMIDGHSGGSGSIKALSEIAEEQSFLLRVLEIEFNDRLLMMGKNYLLEKTLCYRAL